MPAPELLSGWIYEHTDLNGQPHTRARSAAGRATFGSDEEAHVSAAAAAANLAD